MPAFRDAPLSSTSSLDIKSHFPASLPFDTMGQDETTGPPPLVDVWTDTDKTIKYVVLPSWHWVMDSIRTDAMEEVATPADLPSKRVVGAIDDATPQTRQRRRAAQKNRDFPSTLKIEVCDASGETVLFAAHGSSAALDGLEDKDELVRTMQRCRCEDKEISPPSILINWDVTREECLREVGKELPTLEGNSLKDKYVVLKEPMGSQGKGIFFVKTAEEIHDIIERQRKLAQDDPNFFDNLIAAKGRIPSWVIQAEVYPCLLIENRRKFHIRTYLVILEMLSSPDLLEPFIYTGHEVRAAGAPVPEEGSGRDRKVHITNGSLTDTTECLLLKDVDELNSRGIKEKVELFVANTFGSDLVKDIAGRVRLSARENTESVCKFAVAGLDLMVTEENRIYLLEVNSCAAAPKESNLGESFKQHLRDYFHDLTTLVTTGNPPPSFLSAFDILEKAQKQSN